MRKHTRRLHCGAVLVFEECLEHDRGIMAPPSRRVDITLHGLPVGPGDAERLMCVRYGWTSWVASTRPRLHDGEPAVTLLSRIQVTLAEAERLIRGEQPLAVLLPPLYARPLTLEELMAR